jgi:hypothetical protein
MAWQYAALAGYQILSSLQQAEMMEEQGKLQRKVSEMNAEFAEVDAYEAEKAGFTQAARYQANANEVIADQKIAMTSKDIDVTYGTAAELQAESKLNTLLNTLDMQREGRERAMGFRREARQTRLQGSLNSLGVSTQASATRNAGVMNAGATLVSGYSRKD